MTLHRLEGLLSALDTRKHILTFKHALAPTRVHTKTCELTDPLTVAHGRPHPYTHTVTHLHCGIAGERLASANTPAQNLSMLNDFSP